MAASPLAAVGCTRRETSVAFSADLLIAVVFCGEHFQGGLDDSPSETTIQQEIPDE